MEYAFSCIGDFLETLQGTKLIQRRPYLLASGTQPKLKEMRLGHNWRREDGLSFNTQQLKHPVILFDYNVVQYFFDVDQVSSCDKKRLGERKN